MGREEPSCGRFQGSHQLIRPHHPPRTGRKGRRFNSRAKKPADGRSLGRNPAPPIGRRYRGYVEPTRWAANRARLGGSPNQLELHGQRGAVDSALEADSAVPLARGVVVPTLTGPCQRGIPGIRLSRALESGAATGKPVITKEVSCSSRKSERSGQG
ncbi:hypothetical protein KM043_011686 [Ampulex compressa]|nr:hypothetical protein KM043_011686 [Ampulex compressa]